MSTQEQFSALNARLQEVGCARPLRRAAFRASYDWRHNPGASRATIVRRLLQVRKGLGATLGEPDRGVLLEDVERLLEAVKQQGLTCS